jgi:hypothetical protein
MFRFDHRIRSRTGSVEDGDSEATQCLGARSMTTVNLSEDLDGVAQNLGSLQRLTFWEGSYDDWPADAIQYSVAFVTTTFDGLWGGLADSRSRALSSSWQEHGERPTRRLVPTRARGGASVLTVCTPAMWARTMPIAEYLRLAPWLVPRSHRGGFTRSRVRTETQAARDNTA